MQVSRKARSRKGTLDSTPKANGALLALRTSHWCSRMVLRTVSLQHMAEPSQVSPAREHACLGLHTDVFAGFPVAASNVLGSGDDTRTK